MPRTHFCYECDHDVEADHEHGSSHYDPVVVPLEDLARWSKAHRGCPGLPDCRWLAGLLPRNGPFVTDHAGWHEAGSHATVHSNGDPTCTCGAATYGGDNDGAFLHLAEDAQVIVCADTGQRIGYSGEAVEPHRPEGRGRAVGGRPEGRVTADTHRGRLVGLTTSHGCWDGDCISFNLFRRQLAELANYYVHDGMTMWDLDRRQAPKGASGGDWPEPPLDPLIVLLVHSDCDGVIRAEHAAPLAGRIGELLTRIPPQQYDTIKRINEWTRLRRQAEQFMDGLWAAHNAGEDVVFR